MRVRESFRPGDGTLALLLACPGRECVVFLEGHVGRPPKEVDCPEHEKLRHRNGAAQVGAVPEGRPGCAGNRELPAASPRPSAPRPTSTVVEKQEEGPRCAGCAKAKRIAAKGLCWSCYGRARKGDPKGALSGPPASSERPAKAPPRPPAASSERPATPWATVAPPDAALGWRRVREAEDALSAAAGVRTAIRTLSTTPGTNVRDPEERARAVDEVLRAAQAAGWLDPDREAAGSVPGERGCR